MEPVVQIKFSIIFLFIIQFLEPGHGLELSREYTAQETQALIKLKPVVSKYLYEDYMKNDDYLIRFLRSKNLNIDATKKMLIQMVNWRKQNNIDRLVNQTLEIEKLMHYTITHDRIGQPVSTIRISDWQFRRMILAGKANELELGIYKLYDVAIDEIRKAAGATGGYINQGILIVDLTGFNFREHACVRCLRLYIEIFTTYENYYPWLLDKMIILNAPRSFEVFFNTVTPALTQHTRDSVFIYGFDKSEWKPIISKLIPDDQIPTYLGGTYKLKTKLII